MLTVDRKIVKGNRESSRGCILFVTIAISIFTVRNTSLGRRKYVSTVRDRDCQNIGSFGEAVDNDKISRKTAISASAT
jgi:hypothetical protein